MSKFHTCLLIVASFPLYRHASGWIPAMLQRAAPKHSYAVRQSTALLLTPREIERLSGGSGDEDDGQAEEAARVARETLERMWSSSAKDSNENPRDQLDNDDNSEMLPELPELAGELEGEGAQVDGPHGTEYQNIPWGTRFCVLNTNNRVLKRQVTSLVIGYLIFTLIST